MRTYRVVEARSCGIVHTRFTGSLKDCKKWLKDNCWYDEDTNDYYSNVVFCDRSSIYIDDTCNDPENVNGNKEFNNQTFKTMKKIKYEVVKKHCVVEDTTFNGNLDECWRWVSSNCWYDKSTDSYYSNDPKDVDEYGKPFTYHVDVHFDEEQ